MSRDETRDISEEKKEVELLKRSCQPDGFSEMSHEKVRP